jgi:hypothetical protein
LAKSLIEGKPLKVAFVWHLAQYEHQKAPPPQHDKDKSLHQDFLA